MRWIIAGADKVTGRYRDGEKFVYQGVTVEQKKRAEDILGSLGSTVWPAGVLHPSLCLCQQGDVLFGYCGRQSLRRGHVSLPNNKVEAVLKTYFTGYQEDALFWCPLLAYAFMRGEGFVAVPDGGYAMPVPEGAIGDAAYADYDYHQFLNDGLEVVRPKAEVDATVANFQSVSRCLQQVEVSSQCQSAPTKVESLLTQLGIRKGPRVDLSSLTVGPQRQKKELNQELLDFRFPFCSRFDDCAGSGAVSGVVPFFFDEEFMSVAEFPVSDSSAVEIRFWQEAVLGLGGVSA